jgi:hypothetical protein
MSWAIETYSGQKMTGPSGGYRTAMFELCRAVNEREAALARDKTVFFNNAGAPKADVSFAEMLGLKMSGADEPYVGNLEQIQTGIRALLNGGLFTESSGYSDAWTIASMETAIGGSLSDPPRIPNDTAFLQAQKDALDRMIYARTTDNALTAFGTGYAYIPESGVTDYTSLSSVWSHTINRARTTPALIPGGSYYGITSKNSGGFYSPAYWQEKWEDIRTDTSAYSGVLTAVRLNHEWRQNATGALSSPIAFSTGSTFHNSPSFTGTSLDESIAGSTGDFTFPGLSHLDFVGAPTSPCPLDPDSFPVSTPVFYEGKLVSVTSYFNIAAELTDQT